MMRPAHVVRMAATGILLAAAVRGVDAQSSFCRPLDVPGATSTQAHGINNQGDIVGEYIDSGGQHGFLRTADGQFTTIDGPGPTFTIAYGINDAGQIVGTYGGQPVCNCVADIEKHGFVYSAGQMSTFDIGLSETVPLDINNAGEIVGYYHDRDGDIEDAAHGFLLTVGGLVHIDWPGGGGPLSRIETVPTGINDAGAVVGNVIDNAFFMFTWVNGQMTRLPRPAGASGVSAGSIDKSGKIIVGSYNTATRTSGFVRSGQRFSDFNCGGVDATFLSGRNEKGAMVGSYTVPDTIHGFYTLPVTFIDPVPDLVNGTTLTTENESLGTKGRQVQGAAADGTTVVLLRIPAGHVGDQVTVSLLRSDDPADHAISSDEDGALGIPSHTCCQFSVTVASVITGNGPMAFATYRVPADFPRLGGADANLRFRDVFIRFQTAGGSDVTIPLRLIRPLVAAVHGLWGRAATWNAFTPLITGADNRFRVVRVNYDDPIGSQIVTTDPSYLISVADAETNALGFAYNAGTVQVRMEASLEAFKSGENPENIAVAAVQVDVVAHSMGGTIAREMALGSAYTRNRFGQGIIHKLISIDTPHLGSPVATRMLLATSQENNRCLRYLMAANGDYVFNTVTLLFSGNVPAAVGDLRVGSPALQLIGGSNDHPIPAVTIVGEYSSWSSLGSSAVTRICRGSPLAQALTPTGWPAIFSDDSTHRNDGMVSERSQANAGLIVVAPSASVIHSDALTSLGFVGPSVLDSTSTVPDLVISLLNQPVTNSAVYQSITP